MSYFFTELQINSVHKTIRVVHETRRRIERKYYKICIHMPIAELMLSCLLSVDCHFWMYDTIALFGFGHDLGQ